MAKEGSQHRAALFESRAMALRVAGKTVDEIAAILDIPRPMAVRAISRGLKAARRDAKELGGYALELDLQRMDDLIAANWQMAMRGDNKAGMLALQVIDRRAKLLGLDAPSKSVELQSVTSAPFNYAALSREQLAALTDAVSAATGSTVLDAAEAADDDGGSVDYPQISEAAAQAIANLYRPGN